jgi:beta-lactamase regulating signal transducer with metallopeptidase domain/beta-lactamase class D
LAARVRALPAAALRLGHAYPGSWQPSPRTLGAGLLLGVVVGLARILAGWLAVRRLRARAQAVTEDGWTRLVAQLAAQLGLQRRIRLLRTQRHHTPLCLGIVRPAIVLPADAEAWPLARRRAILLHELAHIRRWDCLMQLLSQLACALHFFNPLAWWAAHRLRVERELACDDLVLHAGTRPSEYAGHLLAMAHSGGLPRLSAASLAMVGRGKLERRIAALLDARRSHRPLTRGGALAALLVAMALLLPLSTLRAQRGVGPLPAAMASSLGTPPSSGVGAAPPALVAAVRSYLRDSQQLREDPAQAPSQIELTIDPAIQTIVEDELAALVKKWQATGATAVVLAPGSGQILALASRQAGTDGPGRDLAVQTAFEPGSTMKIFTVATALELHTIRAADSFDCENGSWQTGHGTLRDASPHGQLDVGQILAVSSNIGAQKIYRTFGAQKLERSLARFHFGERPAVQLPAATAGVLPLGGHYTEEQAASIASGQGLRTSPLQTAAAFAAIANDGVYNPPTLARRVVAPTGAVLWQAPASSGERVVSAATAREVLRLLEGVVQGPAGTGTGARVPGYVVAGKTGTANQSSPDGAYADHYYGSFVGAIPARRPAVVILVGVDGPRGEYTGGTVAAPSFARIAARVMSHLNVPRDEAP